MTTATSGRRRLAAWAATTALIIAATALALRPRGEAPRTWTETVRADRGPIPVVLHELGVLAPRDPVIARCPFTARIQWIVEDGTWVEAGDDLYILSDEDEIKRVAELRTQLLQSRAEYKLAALKRRHGETIERPKLAAAERAQALAELKRRLLEARPKGGLELVAIATALKPLAERTAAARAAFEAAQDAYQRALDGYLEALDAWQGGRDALLRLQSKVDELETAGAQEDEAGRADRERRLAEARAKVADEQARAPALAEAVKAAREGRDRLQPARDAAAADLAAAEAAEGDLRFAAEVEKRGLPLARLQLDLRQAVVESDETRRRVEQTRAAVASGSVARSELEKLEDQLRRQDNDLAVVRARIAIESRPPDAKTLAGSDAELEQARTAATDARAAYDRAIALLDQDLVLRQAQVRRLEAQIAQRSAGFPAVLEGGIRFAERELALLGPEEAEERAEAERRLAELRRQYETARGSPPNVIKAPVAGLVRVIRNGDRQRQAGDQAWEADALVEVYPPENMDVLLRVNEVAIPALKTGLAAEVTIPALPGRTLAGEVVQVAGVGRDKFERPEYAGKAGFADVVDFEVRIHLAATQGVELRQGMAVKADIRLGERAGVLRLPLAAVARQGQAWTCTGADGRPRTLHGEPVGPLWFAVADGVAEGEAVLITRTRNR